MRHPLLLLVPCVFMVGCTPPPSQNKPTASSSVSSAAVSSVMDTGTLGITLEKTTTTDKQSIPHTKAKLLFSGAVEKTIDLGDIVGELSFVDPSTYSLYARKNGSTVGVLTAWFAGGGTEIVITKFQDPPSLKIESIEGGEEGICTSETLIAEVTLKKDVQVSLQGFTPVVDQSSLQFCHEKKS